MSLLSILNLTDRSFKSHTYTLLNHSSLCSVKETDDEEPHIFTPTQSRTAGEGSSSTEENNR